MDVNERVQEAWKEDTTPAERVRTIMSRTYEAQPASSIAERAQVHEGLCRWHLNFLAEKGLVEVEDGEEPCYRRAPESVVLERAGQILDAVDVEKLEERVVELREEYGEAARRNLLIAEAVLEFAEVQDGVGLDVDEVVELNSDPDEL